MAGENPAFYILNMKRKSFILLAKQDGRYYGYVESGERMLWSLFRTRVFFGHDYSYDNKSGNQITYEALQQKAKELNRDAKKYMKNCQWKVYRVGSKNCPVKIDWREFVSYKRKELETVNLNLPFKYERKTN